MWTYETDLHVVSMVLMMKMVMREEEEGKVMVTNLMNGTVVLMMI